MVKKVQLTLLYFFVVFVAQAQQISSQLVDSETKEPIPFASILYAENAGVMSNEEGNFDVLIPETVSTLDSLTISSLGYKTIKYAFQDSIPKQILLQQDVYEIDPVIISNKKLSIDEIISNVKHNLDSNYVIDYSQSNFFLRENYTQKIRKFDFDLEKSSIENINQRLFDTITEKLPKNFTALVESYGKLYVKEHSKLKLQLKKNLIIQSKHEQASIQQIQDDFFSTLRKNTKPNSYLIIKSGIIRLDKTESIDSILGEEAKRKTKSSQQKNKGIQQYRTTQITNLLKNLFTQEDSSVDFLNKSNRYNFTYTGLLELDDDLVYRVEFSPKGSAKYKGKLYISTEDFGILRADVGSAHKIFDKHFNMFGVKANDLGYESTLVFSKNTDGKYMLTYLKIEESQEAGIDRPIKIIEKNKFVKGRRKQNQVSFQMNIQIRNYTIRELLLSNQGILTKTMYDSFTPKTNFQVDRLNSYDVNYWKGQNIITPDSAIQSIKIE